MKNRYIAFVSPGKAELLEREQALPEKGYVLVKTAVSTISSGTERANLIGDANIRLDRDSAKAPVKFPRTVGYSSSGVVVAVGEGVESVKVGDRVAVSWGKHSEFQLLEEKNVHPLPENVSFEEAALAMIGTFPMAAIRKCHLEMGESAIVMGLGVLGLFAVQLLRAAGAYPVIAVDPVEEKRDEALSLGADFAFDPFDPDFEEKVRSVSQGGVKVAIEVTGNGKALDQVLDTMARFGRVALLGCTRNSDFTIDYYRKVHGPGVSLIGAHTMARPNEESSAGLWTTKDDLRSILRLISGGRISPAKLISKTHSPVLAPEVFGRLAVENHFPVVQFDWTLLGEGK